MVLGSSSLFTLLCSSVSPCQSYSFRNFIIIAATEAAGFSMNWIIPQCFHRIPSKNREPRQSRGKEPVILQRPHSSCCRGRNTISYRSAACLSCQRNVWRHPYTYSYIAIKELLNYSRAEEWLGSFYKTAIRGLDAELDLYELLDLDADGIEDPDFP